MWKSPFCTVSHTYVCYNPNFHFGQFVCHAIFDVSWCHIITFKHCLFENKGKVNSDFPTDLIYEFVHFTTVILFHIFIVTLINNYYINFLCLHQIDKFLFYFENYAIN